MTTSLLSITPKMPSPLHGQLILGLVTNHRRYVFPDQKKKFCNYNSSSESRSFVLLTLPSRTNNQWTQFSSLLYDIGQNIIYRFGVFLQSNMMIIYYLRWQQFDFLVTQKQMGKTGPLLHDIDMVNSG